jgi:hypothetical protein
MELIISILIALGFISSEKETFNLEKLKQEKKYQKYYEKTGVGLDESPEAWAAIVKKK